MPVHRPSPQLCCVVGGSSGLRCGIPLSIGTEMCVQLSKFHTHNGDDTLPRFVKFVAVRMFTKILSRKK